MKYKLSEIATIKYGKNQKKVLSEFGTVPIYGTGGLMAYATEALYDKPSVLIGRKGTIDKVRFVEHPFWTVDTLFYTIIDESIVRPRYFYYLMELVDLLKLNEGTTIPSLRTETLNKLEFDIPCIEKQDKIISIIKPLEDKIVINNKINDNLLEQALTIFSNIIKDKTKNGCLGDYCKIKSGFAFKSGWWCDTGVKVIKIGSINQDALDLNSCSHVSEDKISLAEEYTVTGGDLLIAMTGATIGKFAFVPKVDEILLVNQRVGKFYLGNNPIEKLPFIYCQLKQNDIYTELVNRGQGSAQPNISAGDIMSIPCVIPTDAEIDEFNKSTKSFFETIIYNQQQNKKLSSIRDTLLPKLMSGELDVSDIEI